MTNGVPAHCHSGLSMVSFNIEEVPILVRALVQYLDREDVFPVPLWLPS